MTKGLDKARELMPQIEAAKKAFDNPDLAEVLSTDSFEGSTTYGEYLAKLGVTLEQVRQWRRRLKRLA